MIKFIATILMLIDHIGYIFFPDIIVWRLIGRLSAPLFAYGIAMGYEYSCQKGTFFKYCRNLVLFSIVSQLPFYLMVGQGANIGFTWTLSLLLLIIINRKDISRPRAIVECLGILSIAYLLKVDYGIYGVFMPLAMRPQYKYSKMFLYMVILWGFYSLVNGVGGLIQVASCAAVLLLALLKTQDNKIKIPRQFFYVFYPIHILFLLMIHYFI